MDTTELKKELISRIAGIDDAEFLEAIRTILDSRKAGTFIELSAELEEELLTASKEAKKGNVVSQSQVDEKIRQWLLKEEK